MSVVISEELKSGISDPESIKVLATKNRNGEVHVAAKGSISLTEDGSIRYLELLESSQTNKNLTYALWFDQKVAINIITKDRRSYQIKGIPRRALVFGREFEEYYKTVVEKDPENDLAAVYFIEPVEVREESYSVRREEQRKEHPLYLHLDRVAADR